MDVTASDKYENIGVPKKKRFRPFIEVCPWDSLHPLLWTEAEQDLLDFSYAYVQLNEILDQVPAPIECNIHTCTIKYDYDDYREVPALIKYTYIHTSSNIIMIIF
jgi:hypothetical protein